MKLDKAEVATRLLVAMVSRGEALPDDHSVVAKWCWSMADAMQAEADKRVVKGVPDSLCNHEHDGTMRMSSPPQYKYKKCGVFYFEGK